MLDAALTETKMSGVICVNCFILKNGFLWFIFLVLAYFVSVKKSRFELTWNKICLISRGYLIIYRQLLKTNKI